MISSARREVARCSVALSLLFPAAGWGEVAGDRLSDEEILNRFADVLDQATLLDRPGTTAVNRWYRDGRFASHWRSGERRGRLSGRWYVSDDRRCVVVETPAAEKSAARCGMITEREGVLYSHNPDGSLHGRHLLLQFPDDGPAGHFPEDAPAEP